jgi:AcrR family transcriptional regulator
VAARRKSAGNSAGPPPSSEDRILDATLAVAARDGWRGASAAHIAAEAQVGLATFYALFPSRPALIAGLLRRVDRAMLASADSEPVEGSPRERLFDVMMRRFEALQPMRAGLAAIAAARLDPLSGLALVGPFSQSLAWMLEAAGIASGGLAGPIRLGGLAVVYAQAFRVWLEDDSADLGKTMAALDRGLARAEQWASALPGVRSDGSAARPTQGD